MLSVDARPDAVILVWLQFGLCAAALELSLEVLCNSALRLKTSERLGWVAVMRKPK